MTPEFWRELPEIVSGRAPREGPSVVLSSTGRHFSAGMDLSVFTGDSSLLGGGGLKPNPVVSARSCG